MVDFPPRSTSRHPAPDIGNRLPQDNDGGGFPGFVGLENAGFGVDRKDSRSKAGISRRGADVPTSFCDAAPRCDASPSFFGLKKTIYAVDRAALTTAPRGRAPPAPRSEAQAASDNASSRKRGGPLVNEPAACYCALSENGARRAVVAKGDLWPARTGRACRHGLPRGVCCRSAAKRGGGS